jgi:hypothetical protein
MSFYQTFKGLVLRKNKKKNASVQAPKEKSLHEKLYDNYVHTLKAEDVKLVDETNKRLVEYQIGNTWLESDTFLKILSFLSPYSLMRVTEVSRHCFLASNTNFLWDAFDGLYNYKTGKSLICFSQGRLDYRTRHKSILLDEEGKKKFRQKISQWDLDETLERGLVKRSRVRETDKKNVQRAKDLVYGTLKSIHATTSLQSSDSNGSRKKK